MVRWICFLLLVLVGPRLHAQSPIRFQQLHAVAEVGGSVNVVGPEATASSAGAFFQPSSEGSDAPPTSLPFGPGSTVQTRDNAAYVSLGDSGNMILGPNTRVEIPLPSDQEDQASLKVLSGRAMLHIVLDKSKPNHAVTIDGLALTAAMTEGTLILETASDGGEAVGVPKGEAKVSRNGQTAEVKKGQMIGIDASGKASRKPMTSEMRDWAEEFPADLLRWESGLIKWDQLKWTTSAKEAGTYVEFEVEDFEHEKLGKGKQLVVEPKQKTNTYLSVGVPTNEIRDYPLAAELWVQTEHPHFACNSAVGGVSLKRLNFWKGSKWRRITLPFEPFPPKGQERRTPWFQFGLFPAPADTEATISVIPGRILVLKKH